MSSSLHFYASKAASVGLAASVLGIMFTAASYGISLTRTDSTLLEPAKEFQESVSNPSTSNQKVVRTAYNALLLEESYGLSEYKAKQFSEWIIKASDEFGVPFSMMASLIMTESSFRYNAVSSVGAIGPAQVVPRFWQQSCPWDLTDPQGNIRCGAKALSSYYDLCNGRWDCALSHYNVGPGNMKRGRYADAAKRYVTKIEKHLAMLKF